MKPVQRSRCLPVLYLSRRTVLIITKAAREGGRKEERRKVGRKDKEGPWRPQPLWPLWPIRAATSVPIHGGFRTEVFTCETDKLANICVQLPEYHILSGLVWSNQPTGPKRRQLWQGWYQIINDTQPFLQSLWVSKFYSFIHSILAPLLTREPIANV